MTDRIAPERFVAVWQASGSVEEASETLGLQIGTVMSRVYRYRKLGVRLKRMPSQIARPSLNVDELNRIAKAAQR